MLAEFWILLFILKIKRINIELNIILKMIDDAHQNIRSCLQFFVIIVLAISMAYYNIHSLHSKGIYEQIIDKILLLFNNVKQ